MQENDHIFLLGIRHHGAGSTQSVLNAFAQIKPDLILLEGPEEADSLLHLASHEEMKPPVALLVYSPDSTQNAVFYPFAEFSPEWQAILYAQQHDIPLRFMDLPQSHQLGLTLEAQKKAEEAEEAALAKEAEEEEAECEEDEVFEERSPVVEYEADSPSFPIDPLTVLAHAAGFKDGERWWEYMVEQRQGDLDLFTGIQEAMTAVREEIGEQRYPHLEAAHREALREAWMRKTLRKAKRDGYERIAVVCGAWHVPALAAKVTVKSDNALLKGLPKSKVKTTWIPWTHERLATASGYGAGISSPEWYAHLWAARHYDKDKRAQYIAGSWLSQVAHLLRKQGIDASTASVIECVRMAETLASLRNKPLPDLDELTEAVITTLCFGEETQLKLITEELIIGQRLGQIPSETPSLPLQDDLSKWQKKLRLPMSADEKDITLDLRTPNGLERSKLFHRLNILSISWGTLLDDNAGKGTFKEIWRVVWQPEFTLRLIEASVWGKTVEEAATNCTQKKIHEAETLYDLSHLLNHILLADLSSVIKETMQQLENQAALASDVVQLMQALPDLVKIVRYGHVRKYDNTQLLHVIETLITRISINLVGACQSLDDGAADIMYEHVVNTHNAINLLQEDKYNEVWQQALGKLMAYPTLHGLVAGRCCRLLLNDAVIDTEQAATNMSYALSHATEPPQAGAWLEGFLRGSGLLLLHSEQLWGVIDAWVSSLNDEHFVELLPLLRRTFSTFPAGERRQMGEQVMLGQMIPSTTSVTTNFDSHHADKILPLLTTILGLTTS